jgi:hypothetical protein
MATDMLMQTQPTSVTMTTNDAWVTVITDDGSGNVTVERTWEGDAGNPPCTEHFTLSRNGQSITSGGAQTCPGRVSTVTEMITVTATISSGGTSYTSSANYTLSGTVGTGQTYAATGVSTGDCTKM